jgi:hypothetical protein
VFGAQAKPYPTQTVATTTQRFRQGTRELSSWGLAEATARPDDLVSSFGRQRCVFLPLMRIVSFCIEGTVG